MRIRTDAAGGPPARPGGSAGPCGAAGSAIRAQQAPARRGLSDARAAWVGSASVGLGMIPLGLAFGALVVQSGLGWWWAGLSATLIYGGSFEFLLIGMVAAAVPLGSIAVAALMVQGRHAFYALSFPLNRVPGRLGRVFSTFALTDEAYALTAAEHVGTWSGGRILWLQFYLYLYWTGSATAGALLGSVVAGTIPGLDFALTALFAVLALDALRDRSRDRSTPLLVLGSALSARLLVPGELLPVAFALFTAALMAFRRLR